MPSNKLPGFVFQWLFQDFPRLAAFAIPIQSLTPRKEGKIDETKLAIYNIVELQIQRYSKRSDSWRAA